MHAVLHAGFTGCLLAEVYSLADRNSIQNRRMYILFGNSGTKNAETKRNCEAVFLSGQATASCAM